MTRSYRAHLVNEHTVYQTLRSLELFGSLKEAWNQLVDRSYHNTIFYKHELFESWLKAYGEGHEFFVVISSKDRQLLSAMPLMKSRERLYGLPIRKISFIVDHEIPHCGPIIDQSLDFSRETRSLLEYITATERDWDVIWLRKLVHNKQMIEPMVVYCRDQGYPVLSRTAQYSPVLRIMTDWESYYSGKSQRFKKKNRNDLNRLKKQGEITVEKFTAPVSIQERMEDVFRVGHQSWKGAINNAIGSSVRNRIFFKGLPGWIASERDGVVLWTLSLDDKMIAFEYHIQEDRTLYALRGEFDEHWRAYSPGAVLDSEIVKDLFSNGIREYNMCGDSSPYKLRWTAETQPHRDIIIFNRTIYGWMLSLIEFYGKPFVKTLLCKRRLGPHNTKEKQ